MAQGRPRKTGEPQVAATPDPLYTGLVRVLLVTLAFLLSIAPVPRAQEATRPAFSEWLTELRTEAVARGIRAEVVDEALATVTEPEPTVIERDRAQAESVFTLEQYLARQLKPAVIRRGREQFAANRSLLEEIARKYGVPAPIIVSIWGLESNFGRFSGVRPTISALATLAWDPRRPALFRAELLNALEILDHGDIDLAHMRGSWAGAMGQPQFLPSSYLKWAEDYDGDGKRDIWSSPADIFASIANYLKAHGWTAGETWGREVSLSKENARTIANDIGRRDGSCQARKDMTVALPLRQWQELGVRTTNGRPLPKTDTPAALVSGSSRHFLVYGNYDALLEYNCSHAYAITVALLSERVRTTATPVAKTDKVAKADGQR